MTRFWTHFLLRTVLACAGTMLLAIGIGYRMPVERELLFTASFGLRDLNIYRMSLSRHITTAVTKNPANDFMPDWSADGRQIAFVSDRDGNYSIYITDADGSHTRRMMVSNANQYSPVWSPDSRQIAYVEEEGGYGGVMLYDLASGATQALTDTYRTHVSPIWKPDGKEVTFVSDLDERWNTKIYTVNVASHVVTPILVGSAVNPVWAPDGRYLLYSAGYEKVNLYLWDDQLQKSDLLYDGDFVSNDTPAWSADGQTIIFVALTTNGNSGIFQLPVAACLAQTAACIRQELTTTPAFYRNPHWGPNQSITH